MSYMRDFMTDRINTKSKTIAQWAYPEIGEMWVVRVAETPIITDRGFLITVRFEYVVMLLNAGSESEKDHPNIVFRDLEHAMQYAERLVESL